MSEQPGLFDVEGLRVPTTPTARRRAREAVAIRVGYHPLTKGRLHPDVLAGRPGAPTCGTCRFRRAVERYTGAPAPALYPKCWYAYPSRMGNGPATDVLASWPACTDWLPKGQD